MVARTWELKLRSGRVVRWEGETPEDAGRRYVELHPAEAVVAWRHYPQHGLFELGDVRQLGGI